MNTSKVIEKKMRGGWGGGADSAPPVWIGLKPDPINYFSENNKVNKVKDIIIKFKNHPSIIKIKEKEENSEDEINTGKTFRFCEINENVISKLLNDLKTDISTGEDTS